LFVVSLYFVSPLSLSLSLSLSLVIHVCIFIYSEALDSKSSMVVGAYVTAGHCLQSLFFQIIDPLVHHIHPIRSKFVLITFCDFQFSPDLSNPLLL
jgi:hypothetical protein